MFFYLAINNWKRNFKNNTIKNSIKKQETCRDKFINTYARLVYYSI